MGGYASQNYLIHPVLKQLKLEQGCFADGDK
mgnify:CR=1 FL=1